MATEPSQAGEPPAAEFSIWFANDGGPLLVLPVEWLPSWDGCNPPSDARVIKTAVNDMLGEYIPCTVEPGSYRIAERTFVLPPGRGNSEIVLCRLQRMPSQNEPA